MKQNTEPNDPLEQPTEGAVQLGGIELTQYDRSILCNPEGGKKGAGRKSELFGAIMREVRNANASHIRSIPQNYFRTFETTLRSQPSLAGNFVEAFRTGNKAEARRILLVLHEATLKQMGGNTPMMVVGKIRSTLADFDIRTGVPRNTRGEMTGIRPIVGYGRHLKSPGDADAGAAA